jgi:hypothetical protein
MHHLHIFGIHQGSCVVLHAFGGLRDFREDFSFPIFKAPIKAHAQLLCICTLSQTHTAVAWLGQA